MPIPTPHECRDYIEVINVTEPFNAETGVGTKTSTFTTAWAAITDIGGSLEAADQQHRLQLQQYEVWLRYIDDLTGFMQIVWGSKTLTIVGTPQKVLDAQGRRWWAIQARYVSNQDLT